MPIVSEHPLSTDVFRRIHAEYDQELETYINRYTERRKAYHKMCEQRRVLVGHFEDEDRADMNINQLLDILVSRETAVDDFRDELALLDKELMLIKREMRRVRRRLLNGAPRQDWQPEIEPDFQMSVPQMPSVQDYIQKARTSEGWSKLKPWLRSFLPDSA